MCHSLDLRCEDICDGQSASLHALASQCLLMVRSCEGQVQLNKACTVMERSFACLRHTHKPYWQGFAFPFLGP